MIALVVMIVLIMAGMKWYLALGLFLVILSLRAMREPK